MIDLHIHSLYSSDGEFTPQELVEKCFKKGITMMSISDHNCVHANEEAINISNKMGITYITGIEIDCTYEDTNFHMLGYNIDFKSSDFEQIEKNVEDQSFHASIKMLAETQKLGFNITENDMWSISKNSYCKKMWTGEMFAEVLLAKPEYINNSILQPYRAGGSRSDNPYVNFYWDYYSQGKPCYAKIDYPSMEEIINIIHRNNGVAVIAHPGVNLKGKEFLLDGIIKLGIDGIEAFSSYHTQEQSKHFNQIADEKNLFTTCGSDYHGKTKPAIEIGQHYCSIPYEKMIKQLNEIF